MFYYKFPFDVTFYLKDIGLVRRAVDFSKDELLTTAELRKWLKRPAHGRRLTFLRVMNARPERWLKLESVGMRRD